jgi:hypothetical protein
MGMGVFHDGVEEFFFMEEFACEAGLFFFKFLFFGDVADDDECGLGLAVFVMADLGVDETPKFVAILALKLVCGLRWNRFLVLDILKLAMEKREAVWGDELVESDFCELVT